MPVTETLAKTDPRVPLKTSILTKQAAINTCLLSQGERKTVHLVALLPERATFSQSSPSSGWLAKHCGATSAEHHRLRVAEHSCDAEASLTLHIHEEGVRRLHETFQLMLSLLQLRRGVQEVDIVGEHHVA